MPADEISIREMSDGQGAFVADMRINLWQKRMRVSGRVSVEFIARGMIPLLSHCSRLTLSLPGRIWSLTFFSPPPTTRTAVGMWKVALCLLEHSPPTFVHFRLIIDLPPPSSDLSAPAASASRTSDLISLSPPLSPTPSHKSKSKFKAPETIEVALESKYRLAYRASNTFIAALDTAFSSQKEWRPPHFEQWTDNDGSTYINAIVVPFEDDAGGELLYE